MSTNFQAATFARAAAVALALAIPVASAAHADDEYASNRSPSILHSAQSVFYNPAETPLARATAAAKAASTAYAANPSTVASDAAQGAKPLDLNGQGGAQDQLGREIYQPGGGTDW